MADAADSWLNRKVLVTGGCGFIGRHLVRHLVGLRADVTVLDDLSTGNVEALPAGVKFVQGSVVDVPLVKELLIGMAGCFHLAAVASVQRSVQELVTCHSVNETGTLAIIEGLRDTGGRLVYASSSAVFGHPSELPLHIGSATRPISPYGVSKLTCEWHARVAGTLYGLPSFGLRFFNVYGPEQRADSPYSGVIAIFADRVANGLPLTINGSGEQSRDFVFVSDVVEGLIAAWSQANTAGPVELIGTGESVSVRQLADIVMKTLRTDVLVSHGPEREGDIQHSFGLCPFLAQILGRPAIPLHEGLARFIGRDAIRPTR